MGQLLACIGIQAAKQVGEVITSGLVTRMRPRGRSVTRRPRGPEYIGPQVQELRHYQGEADREMVVGR